MECQLPARHLDVCVSSLEGLWDASLPIAAARAGALGLLNLVHLTEATRATDALRRLTRLARGRAGVLVEGRASAVTAAVLDHLTNADTLLFTVTADATLPDLVQRGRAAAQRIGFVVTTEPEARQALALGADLLFAKGHEAGGTVGEETAFVLFQRLMRFVQVPLYVWGGIGFATAAACQVAGAAGVVLDWQLALLAESPVPAAFRARIARMDGSETALIRTPDGHGYRLYAQPGMAAREQLEGLTEGWEQRVAALLDEPRAEARLWPVGQDGSFAAPWAAEVPTVARALGLLRERVEQTVRACMDAGTLKVGSPLAKSHGTEFPILQGPMTRVSDVPEFADAVARGGALPFLALALLRGPQVRDLMEKTRDLLGNRPWGVGILGFVERELRAEQLAVVEAICPPYAIIAGGRPDQAVSLEARGIATYLHVPSPGMLETFLREGARRFIFEGRECGGHVGPRSSFVLWETMIRVLLAADLPADEAARVHVVFAGGINDGLSGAMVAALAQPLVARGMKVGALLGTAYLFTEEIVATGAIVPGFQDVALRTEQTVLVESGPGHAVRCAPTDFVRLFEGEKQRLRQEGRPAEEVRGALEDLNLGRLRIASKGITRAVNSVPGPSQFLHLDADGQQREGMYMIGQIAALRSERCTIRKVHEDVCLGALSRLEQLRTAPAPRSTEPGTPLAAPLDIAIVGLSCFLPGAESIAEFWQNILAKRDLITEVPPRRFEADRWYDPDRKARDRVNSKWGGFLGEILFDPLKYGIPPTTIPSIEPGQLLALELVDRVLRDAGYGDRNPYKERTNVVFGVSGGVADLAQKYIVRALLPQFIENPDESLWQQLPEWTEDSFAGLLPNVTAGRISNRFDLGGANFTVDAACASSLAAIYLACRALADGSSDMAIAGGCDLVQNAFAYLCFATAGALSPRGRSRTFDENADGIAISEGLAAVALKRLADAERDGDRIYAVIRAAAGASDGKSKGLTAPRPEGQMRTLERAYAQAGFSPATVGLFEAHGTGTAVGDATECQALTQVLTRHGAGRQSAAVGSIKSMIGHTKSTAGVAGLVKAALALHYRVLPPTLHVEKPNAKAGLLDGPVYVNRETLPWIAGREPRRAGISSFGFGGTNFHVVLEEYADAALARRPQPHRDWPTELFLVTGKSAADLGARLRGFAGEVRAALDAGAELALADLAFTLHRRSAGTGQRAAVVASTVAELLDLLGKLADVLSQAHPGKLPPGTYWTPTPLAVGTPLAFLFPGQGAQFPGMLCDLAVEFAEVADTFAEADAALAGHYDRPLSRYVFPPPAFSDAERARAAEELKATTVTQPALGVCGVALARLLAAFGVRPAMAAGHSYGELAALCIGGALNEPSLYQLSWARGNAMVQGSKPSSDLGTMLAVQGDPARVRQVVAEIKDVWCANHNSPHQMVISGTRPGIAAAAQALDAAGLTHTALAVGCAFHSPLMAPARESFEQALWATEVRSARVPVYSNVAAAPHSADPDAVRGLLRDQLVYEVRFAEEVEAMYAAGARVFVELGPTRVVAKLVDQILGDRPHAAVAVQLRERHGLTQLLHALAALAVHGTSLDLERLYEGRERKLLELRSPNSLKKPAPAPHQWVLSGGEARPAHQQRRPPVLRAVLGQKGVAMPTSGPTAAAPSGVPHSSTPERSPVAPAAARNGSHAPSAPATADGDVYAQFQETMRAFLTTQQRVMEAFLTNTVASPRHETEDDLLPDAPVLAQPLSNGHKNHSNGNGNGHDHGHGHGNGHSKHFELPTSKGNGKHGELLARPVAPPHLPTVPTRPRVDLAAMLFDVASQRTGYPTEMLTLDANLEADLGIDSIKRVEIIAAFRRTALPELHEPPSWFMERMTAAKTLQAILAGVAELAGTSSEPEQQVVAARKIDKEDTNNLDYASLLQNLEATLLRIVSERTGYPTEMLTLGANLEADLGIDSIKRVEVIAAFRRTVLPSLEQPPAWFMERMTAAKTLSAILAGVGELARPQPAVPASPAPAAAPAGSPTPAIHLADLLLRITSERTGYPPEMLDKDANLEADLGIDSIKRVEIIAAFRRTALPELHEPPPWFMEEMTAAKTLSAILTGVGKLRNLQFTRVAATAQDNGNPKGNGHPLPSRPQPVARLPRCTGALVELPFDFGSSIELPHGVLVITDDGDGYAASLAREICDGGGTACLLAASDLDSRETVVRALARLRQEHDRIGGILHLLPVRPAPAFPGIGEKEYTALVRAELLGFLHLMQGIQLELSAAGDHRVVVAAVSRGGGDFGGAADAAHPWRGGLAGMLKTAAREWPGVRFRHVDADELPEPIYLLREFFADGPVEVGYRRGKRLGIEAHRDDLPAASMDATTSPLDRNDVILITGGAQGITGEVARELAQRTKGTLLLLGRTAPPPAEEAAATAGLQGVDLRRMLMEQLRQANQPVTPREVEARVQRLMKERDIRTTLAELRATGARIEYHACDVRDAEALARTVADAQQRLGAITAVVHGAGVIEDRHIPDKTAESFERVFHTKVAPLLTLADQLDPRRLKAVVLFGSVAGFFGNVGQVDYAAANETLNRMARRLQGLWPGKIVALNWGPWSGAGMVTPEVARQFESRGVPMIGVAAGRAAVWQELAHATGQEVRVVLGPGPWVESAPTASPSVQAIPVATPLLTGHSVYQLPHGEIEAHVVFDPTRHAYLRDHLIEDKPVVPLAVALELMAETAAAARPDWHVTHVVNVRMFKGIVLEENQREIVLRAEATRHEGTSGEWRVSITDPQQNHRPLYEAHVRLASEPLPPPEAPAMEPTGEAFPLSTRDAYQRWLFHGPHFQVIQQLEGLDHRGIDAVVQPASSHHVLGDSIRQGWLIDPIVLDSAAQLSTLWSRATYGVTTLPNRVETYHRYGALGSGPLQTVWRVDRGSDRHCIKAQVWFLRGNRVVGHLDGLEGSGNEELNRITGVTLR